MPMIKVHIRPSTTARLVASGCALGFCLLLSACEPAETPPEPGRAGGRFGDAYQVLTNEHPDALDEAPLITSDTLHMLVSYAGGCENHDFDLDFEAERDTTTLWLHHNDGGDDCEAMILDRLSFHVPEDALNNPTILLQNPNDSVPFIVQRNVPRGGP